MPTSGSFEKRLEDSLKDILTAEKQILRSPPDMAWMIRTQGSSGAVQVAGR